MRQWNLRLRDGRRVGGEELVFSRNVALDMAVQLKLAGTGPWQSLSQRVAPNGGWGVTRNGANPVVLGELKLVGMAPR